MPRGRPSKHRFPGGSCVSLVLLPFVSPLSAGVSVFLPPCTAQLGRCGAFSFGVCSVPLAQFWGPLSPRLSWGPAAALPHIWARLAPFRWGLRPRGTRFPFGPAPGLWPGFGIFFIFPRSIRWAPLPSFASRSSVWVSPVLSSASFLRVFFSFYCPPLLSFGSLPAASLETCLWLLFSYLLFLFFYFILIYMVASTGRVGEKEDLFLLPLGERAGPLG